MGADAPIQRLFEEIHRRSMWQVLGIYLGSSWGVLEVVGELIDRLLLPESVFRVAIVLLAVGLPIMLATAYFEGSRRQRAARPGGGVAGARGPRRWFTWRNALLGGSAAFALLGVAAAAFMASRAFGVGFAAPLIAQGVLQEREPLVLAELENRTADSLLARAVTEALRIDLSQSSALRLIEAEQIRATLVLMERAAETLINEELAGEIAQRNGVKAYLAGAVDQFGAGYTLSVRLVSAESGADLIALRESADDADDVIGAVDRLSRKLRARIGESLGSVNAASPLPDVTTRSLPALEKMAVGAHALRTGDRVRAIRLLEEAVRLDTTFASAYRALSIAYANLGDMVSSDRTAALARRYVERLPLRERYLVEAAYHYARGRRDSVAHYHQLLLDADPLHYASLNNLGDTYEWMGRFDEALALYRRSAALQPEASVARINLASIGRTLGMPELADSAVDAMAAAGEPLANVLPQRMANAIYALREDRLDALLAAHAGDREPFIEGLLAATRAVGFAMDGHPARAMAAADSSAALAEQQRLGEIALMIWLSIAGASIAADDPAGLLARLESWSIAEKLGGSAPLHSQALAMLAEAYVRAGRPADAERVLADATAVAGATDFHQPGAVTNAAALLALSRGDPAGALEQVQRAIDADFGLVRRGTLLTRALAFEALGRHAEAARDFEALTSSRGLFWMDLFQFPALLPYAHERAGSAWLATGDTARALRHLGAFTELWSDADPQLQPRVRAAAATIEAILRERG